jgi:hypothetical protein
VSNGLTKNRFYLRKVLNFMNSLVLQVYGIQTESKWNIIVQHKVSSVCIAFQFLPSNKLFKKTQDYKILFTKIFYLSY